MRNDRFISYIRMAMIAILTGMLMEGCANAGDTGSVSDTGQAAPAKEARTDMAVFHESEQAGAQEEAVAAAKAQEALRAAAQEVEADAWQTGEVQVAETDPAGESGEAGQLLEFVDIFGQSYQTAIDPRAAKHDFRRESFVRDGYRLSYQDDERYLFRLGVDVSYHQGTIDWAKVKNAGYDFAFLRIGYRGYGQAGSLGEDTKFRENLAGARAAGLDVGVYFFAQAVNEQEAQEEAQFVLKLLGGEGLQLPVVYDPEKLPGITTRVDNLTGEQFTKNVLAFAQTIQAGGYQPMLYTNMLFEAFEYDLTQLSDLEIWYADYEPYPQTPYSFSIWQYTNEGRVDGIAGGVDLNIQLIPAGGVNAAGQ